MALTIHLQLREGKDQVKNCGFGGRMHCTAYKFSRELGTVSFSPHLVVIKRLY